MSALRSYDDRLKEAAALWYRTPDATLRGCAKVYDVESEDLDDYLSNSRRIRIQAARGELFPTPPPPLDYLEARIVAIDERSDQDAPYNYSAFGIDPDHPRDWDKPRRRER